MQPNSTNAIPALFVLLIAFGCGSDDEKPVQQPPAPQKQTPQKAPASAPTEDPGLTEPMVTEFGAATWVPESSSLFASSLRLKQQWEAVRDSNAIALLLDLPTVQMALGELTRSEQWTQLQQMRQQNPQVASGLDVLADAFSQEAFMCLDEKWPDVVTAISAIYVQSMIASMQRDESATANAAIAAVINQTDTLRLPGTLIGFRMSDPARAQELLKELITQLKSAVPLPITEEEIGGSKFHTLRMDATAIPPKMRRDANQKLQQTSVPPDRVTKLNAWLDSLTLAVAIGLRDDYLLISIGADTTQLEALGAKSSLAMSEQFAPVRRCFKPGVLSLSYLCAELTNSGKIPVDDALAMLDEGLTWFGETPAELPARLRKDAAGFLEDLNNGLPEAHAELHVTFLNRGVESYSFGAVLPGMDASRPLSILSSAGPAPLLAIAGRSLPSRESWERLTHWIDIAYGYFEDYAVPRMSKSDLAQFSAFEETFLIAAHEMQETTLNKLIPAVDACQGLFVLSGDGMLPMIPGLDAPLPRPLPYPRPAMVFEINDAKLLTTAFAEYRTTVNTLLATLAKKEPDLKDVEIPAPASRDFAGGKLYTYPMPIPPELKLLPHAVVTKDRAVLAIAEDHSAALLKSTPIPTGGVVDLTAPAGAAGWVDIAGITNMLFDEAEIVLHVMASEGEIDPQTVDLVKGHFPIARRVLGVFKSYTSRTWVEGDTAITHSWLRIEDAKR